MVAFTVITIMFIEEEANMIKQMLGQMYSTSIFQHSRLYKTHQETLYHILICVRLMSIKINLE